MVHKVITLAKAVFATRYPSFYHPSTILRGSFDHPSTRLKTGATLPPVVQPGKDLPLRRVVSEAGNTEAGNAWLPGQALRNWAMNLIKSRACGQCGKVAIFTSYAYNLRPYIGEY